MKIYIRIFGVAFILFAHNLFAQQDLVTHFLRNTWQANLTNPALLPNDRKIHICTASYYFSGSSPVSISDFITKPNTKNVLSVNNDSWVYGLDDKNYLESNVNIQTGAISFPVYKNVYVNLNHAFVYNQYTDFSRNIPELLYRGNAPFIGKTADLSHNILTEAHSELGLGLTYKVENLSLGIRLKSYNGMGGVFTGKSDLALTTDTAIYALKLQADYQLKVFEPYKDLTKALTSNGGYGVDLGFAFKFPRLEVAISALDLNASMLFKNNGKTYSAKGIEAFDGLETFNLQKTSYSELRDTIKSALNIKEEAGGEFVVNLPPRIYASALYQITPQFRMGGLLYTESTKFETKIGISLNGQYDITPWFNMGMSYSIRDNQKTNIGMYSSMRLWGKVQLYSATDNILTFFNPFDARSSNARFGMNITLGEVKEKKKKIKKGTKKAR
jgi:Family of unknown function (DUF5723)